MPAYDEVLIRVQSEWNGWRSAEIRLRDLQSVHWFQPDEAPHPLLHAFILCTNLVSGDIPHDCDRTPPPHRLLVCVLKRHTTPSTYAHIARRADEQRTFAPTAGAGRTFDLRYRGVGMSR